MIPCDYITEWRAAAPWVQDFQGSPSPLAAQGRVGRTNQTVYGFSNSNTWTSGDHARTPEF